MQNLSCTLLGAELCYWRQTLENRSSVCRLFVLFYYLVLYKLPNLLHFSQSIGPQ